MLVILLNGCQVVKQLLFLDLKRNPNWHLFMIVTKDVNVGPVSTCDLKIKMPVHIHSMPVHIHSEEEMRVMMISAIKHCTGFGLV